MEKYAADFDKVAKLNDQLQPLIEEKSDFEDRWMELAEILD